MTSEQLQLNVLPNAASQQISPLYRRGSPVNLTGYYYVSEVNEGTTVGDGILSTGGFDDFDTNARTFSMQVNLGVDVLHLKFESGEKSFTIGVVATPIDVGRDITPDPEAKPDGNWMWWCIIAGAIVIVLMIADGILENKAGGTIL